MRLGIRPRAGLEHWGGQTLEQALSVPREQSRAQMEIEREHLSSGAGSRGGTEAAGQGRGVRPRPDLAEWGGGLDAVLRPRAQAGTGTGFERPTEASRVRERGARARVHGDVRARAAAARGHEEERSQYIGQLLALARDAMGGAGVEDRAPAALPGPDDPFWEPVPVVKRKSPLAPAVLAKLTRVRLD